MIWEIPGIEIVTQIAEMFALHGIDTEIISASVRNTISYFQFSYGRIYNTLQQFLIMLYLEMVKHPLTDAGMKKFIEDYNKAFNK